MKIMNKFYFYAVWTIPFGLSSALILNGILTNIQKLFPLIQISDNMKSFISISVFLGFWTIFFIRNLLQYIVEGKRDFLPKNHQYSEEKQKALMPKIPKGYLSKTPKDQCIGKYKGKYICLPFSKNAVTHKLIIGGPGSGKSSSAILNSLIYNFNFAQKADEAVMYILDIKPELQFKSAKNGSKNIHVVNPTNKTGYGWNVWYGLSQENTDDELISRADIIARALIVCTNENNQFFYTAAQTLMKAFIVYGFRNNQGLCTSIQRILFIPLQDLIAEIITDEETIKNHPKLIGMIKGFDGKDSKAVDDIELTLRNELSIFQYDVVKYQFEETDKKANPQDLENGISIFLTIPDHLLSEYAPIIRLITQMVMKFLGSLSEKERSKEDKPLIILFLDEFPSIGRMDDIIDGLARLRSRKISIQLCIQSLAQMDTIYGKDATRAIVDNTETTIVLSCKDPQTTKMISEWSGMYDERKISKTRKPRNIFSGSDSLSESSEQRNTLEINDIMSLLKNNQVLVFDRGNRLLVEKCPYYSIDSFNKKSIEIQKYNQKVEEKNQ